MALTLPWRHRKMTQSTVCTEECGLHTYQDGAPTYDDANLVATSSAHCNSLDQAALAEQLYGPIHDWEIRILALRPGRLGERLEARLHLAAFSNDKSVILHDARIKTTYEALSYCWGPPVFDRSIHCNGVEYPITQSLYHGLQRLRQDAEVRYLWVNQLCINQHNLPERSIQVQKMHLIYETARQVLVWLGEAGPNTGAAIDIAADVWKRTPAQSHDAALGLQIARLCRPHFDLFFDGVQELLSRPWYNRLWIVQEIYSARYLGVYCGPKYFPMGSLQCLSKALTEHNNKHHDPFIRLRTQLSPGHREELLTLLQRVSTSECSDVRDRIYGVLAIGRQERMHSPKEVFDPDGEMTIRVDYSRSASQIYQDVVKSYVDARHGLAIFAIFMGARLLLDHTTIFGGEVNGCRIPSWCPNFSKPWEFGRELHMHRELRHHSIMESEYTSSKKRKDDQTFLERSFVSDILHV